MTSTTTALSVVAASNRAILDQIAADPKNHLAAQILEDYEGAINPTAIIFERLVTLLTGVVNYLAAYMPAIKANLDHGTALPTVRPNPYQAQYDAYDAQYDAAMLNGEEPPVPPEVTPAMQRVLDQSNARNLAAIQVLDMHHYLLHTLLKCAKVHQEAAFIDQPPNADGIILRSIQGQTLHGAIASLRLRVGGIYDTDKTRMLADLARLKMPRGTPFADWAALFSSRVNDLEVLAKVKLGGQGRESEVFNLFEQTLTVAYNGLLLEFATTHHATNMRTFQIFKNWAMPRVAYIEDLDKRAVSAAMATAAALTIEEEAATATANNVAQATANGIAIIKTLTEAQLREAGLKLTKIGDQKEKTNYGGGRKPKPTNAPAATGDKKQTPSQGGLNIHAMAYCWTHGYYATGHRALHKSADCKFPGTGHETTATGKNTMGGSGKVNN
jgi:hypothetical protein